MLFRSYLLIAFILGCLTFFLPIMNFATPEGDYSLSCLGLRFTDPANSKVLEHLWALVAISAIIPIISLITINLYKHRTAQIRLSIFNMLLMLGYYAIYFFYFYYIGVKYNVSATFAWPVVLPVVSLILTWLAIRAIAKDEALVQSLNRLR